MQVSNTSIIIQEQYDVVADRIEKLINAAPCTDEAAELRLLVGLVVEFERERLTAAN